MERVLRSLKSPKSDPQREALYQLEREFRGPCRQHTAPESYLRRIMRQVCRMYRVSLPTLQIRNVESQKWSAVWYSPTRAYPTGRIVLYPYSGANIVALLHELAHHIDYFRDPDDEEAHNPYFVGIYAFLLAKFQCLPLDAFAVMARRWKVRYVDPVECSPSALKHWRSRTSTGDST